MEKWRRGCMLFCVGVLVLALLTIFVRFGTEQVLVKRLHLDNVLTRAVLFDNAALREAGKANGGRRELPVDWAKRYPFPAESQSLWMRAGKAERRVEARAQKAEKKVEDWATENFLLYQDFVEAGRSYERAIGWRVVNPAQQVTFLPDGALTFAYPRNDVTERVRSVEDFAAAVRAQGAAFYFVQAPFKVDPTGDEETRGRLDFSNENADDLVRGLRQGGVPVLDLRDALKQAFPAHPWHDFFYRTDHHWRPETALWAADELTRTFSLAGFAFDEERLTPTAYEWQVYPAAFLGSQGKKVTLARTRAEDFTLPLPRFDSEFEVTMPEYDFDERGGFTLLYDWQQLEKKDLYHSNPYATFSYGDRAYLRIQNFDPRVARGPKILAVTDSFGDTLVPFLATTTREILKVDLRHFTGSLRALLAEEKPDLVFLMYTAGYSQPIKWQGHEDEFDFR